ncbi:MAG: sugar transporter permease [Paenibacillaceae bacterium]|jgi:putative aldouronate transport system permease protein|nr:sugar transporter permease [Paenibacillaceae bacterium]
MKKATIPEKAFDGAIIAIVTLLAVISVYPLLYVAFASVSDGDQLMSHTGLLLKPYSFNLDAYHMVFKNRNILTGYSNTLFIVFASLLINLTMTSMAAYVLSRKQVLWNPLFMFMIVFTMFFHGGLIPFYLIVKGVGLLNSLWSVIIPFAINTFNLIIMRTSFMAIPDTLEESAKIDGANHFVIFTRIIIPLSLPVLAVITLYYSVEKWNAWFYASIFLKDREMYPLQLILREILIANNTDSMSGGTSMDRGVQVAETIRYATIMVATVPILFVYPFVQKYFVKGVMVGALKG